jgi:hypothetical protein
MQSGTCEAVLAIDARAWDGALAGSARDEVTVEGTTNEKPPTSLANFGGKMEREEGI